MSKDSAFWDERYEQRDFVYGVDPSAFVASEAHRLRPTSDILELGGGEGRNAVWLARQGHHVTVLDYAAAGLRKAEGLAREHGVSVEPVQADVRSWKPERHWDALVVTFLHLPPTERPALYRLMQQVVRPEGLIIAEWFRPEQVLEAYGSGGPPSAEMMVTAEELRANFAQEGMLLLEETETMLDEGAFHKGLGAVVRLVWQKST